MREHIRKIIEESRSMHECIRHKAKIIKGIRHAHRKKQSRKITEYEFDKYLNQKHMGFSKREWVSHCDNFSERAHQRINGHFNELFHKWYSSHPQANMVLITALVLLFAYLLVSPSLIGFVILEQEKSMQIGQEFDQSQNLSLEESNIKSFYLNGYITKNFSGAAYLNDGASRYLLLNYSVPAFDQEVEDSKIEISLDYREFTPEAIALDAYIQKISPKIDNYSKLCTKWTIASLDDSSQRDVCYGNSECCSFINLEPEEEGWNYTLYLNKGKYGAGDRDAVKAQIYYVDYELKGKKVHSDIRYSNIKGKLVSLFENLSFNACGEACDIYSEADDYFIEVLVENGSIYLSNATYIVRTRTNNAPSFSEMPNLTIEKNNSYTIDLSEYVSDGDNDEITITYFEADGIKIEFSGLNAKIIPDSDFTGKTFTFFVANDSKTIGISNIIEVDVVENLSSGNISKVKPEAEGFIPEGQVEINKDVVWKKNIKANISLNELRLNVSGYGTNITVLGIVNGSSVEISGSNVEVIDNGTSQSLAVYKKEAKNRQLDRKLGPVLADTRKNLTDIDALKELRELYYEKISVLNDSLYAESKGRKGIEKRIKILQRRISELDERIANLTVNNVSTNETVPEEEVNQTEDNIIISPFTSSEVEVVVNELYPDMQVSYVTQRPTISETLIDSTKKIINVSSDVHYTNILSYADITEAKKENIKLYQIVNESRILVTNVSYVDRNNNSLIDRIYWVVPSLSSQVYEIIIEISKAEHLDSNRQFISDIYDYVKVKDGNWSEAINNSEYVRVTFVTPLDHTKDITIYAKANNTSEIDVYTKDNNTIIARFANVLSEGWYKVYLTNLTGSHDTFDLRINGSVQFDYIVDPYYAYENIEGNFNYTNITFRPSSNSFLTTINESLVLYLPFDVDTSTESYDFSPNNCDGTNSGASIITSSDDYICKYSKCAYFSPHEATNNYISVTNSEALNPANITVSAWFFMTEAETSGIVVKMPDAGGSGYRIILESTFARGDIRADSLGTVGSLEKSPISAGQWYHVAMTYNGSDMALYLGGTQVDSISLTGNITPNSMDVQIGRLESGYNLKGAVDDVMIFNTSLSATEILNIYNNQSNRHYHRGELTVSGLNLTSIAEVDAELTSYQSILGSFFQLSVNNGSSANITGGSIFAYVLSGISGLENANLSLIFNPSPYNFYTPIFTGNLLLTLVKNTFMGIDFVAPTYANASATNSNSIPINISTYNDRQHYVVNNFNNSLVRWWRLETGAKAIDSAGGNNNGTFGGGVTSVAGKLNNAFDFDGSSGSFTFDDCSGFDFGTGNWSIFAWINTTSSKSIIGLGNSVNEYQGLAMYISEGKLKLDITGHNVGLSAGTVASGEWTYVGAVYNGSNIILYVNGSADNVSSSTPNIAICDSDWNGIGVNTGAGKFGGKMDEVSIWNKALSGSEISALYNSGSGTESVGNEDGLVGLYHMEELRMIDELGKHNETLVHPTFATGKFGNAYSFDGSTDYISFDASDLPTGNKSRTISTWFKATSLSHAGLVTYGSYSGNHEFGLQISGLKLMFWGHGEPPDFYGNTTLSAGVWYHGAVTYNETVIKLYLNGIEDASLNYTLNTTVSGARIGSGSVQEGDWFSGIIDDILIFNRSLSASEIQSLYDARADQFNYNDSTMKLRVNMDAINASGHPLDLSSYSHNLTKNGNAVQVDGRIGKAFSFDGNGDYINTTYQQINATKYSISAWIKTTDTTSNLGIVQNRGSGAGNSLTLGMNYLGSNRIFFAFDTDGTIIGRYYDSASVNNGAWHHVVGVFNGSASVTSSEFILYFDGVSVSTGAFETGSGVAPLTGLGNTIIGYNEAWNTYYNGLIDEVLIFNRTLSYSEVLTLYSVGNQYYNNFTNLSEGTYQFDAYIVDRLGNKNSSSRTLTLDTTNPSINFTAPTEGNNSYLSRNNILVNVSVTDTNFKNVTIYLYNSSKNLLNSTNQTTSPFYMNFSNLTSQTYYFNATAFDLAGNSNSTETRQATVDVTTPTITLYSPANQTNTNVSLQTFICNITDNLQIKNLTLYIWNTSNQINYTNTTVLTGTSNSSTWNYTLPYDGIFYWNCLGYDNMSNSAWAASGNYTITLDTVVPSINYTSPTEGNNSYLSRNNILVNVSVTDTNFKNVTIYLYNSSKNLINSTNQTTSPFYMNFSNLTSQTYYFNATAFDIAGNSNSTETRQATVDTINPSVNFTAPTEGNNSYLSRNNILVNVSVTDTNFKNVTIYLYNSSKNLINSTNQTTSPFYMNFSNLTYGNYYFNATAFDLAGNKNSTETRNITVDLTAPTINFTAPTEGNNTIVGRSYILVNVTSTDTYFANITIYLYNSSRNLINSTNQTTSPFYMNFSNLTSQTYYFNATAFDLAGNKNSTETRNVTIDLTPPAINFTSPTPSNASTVRNYQFDVNVSTTDISEHYSFVDFDNSLVGWWRGENNASDESGYGNNGTWVGTQNYSSGKFGKTITLHGNSGNYVTLPNIDLSSKDFSISFWVKRENPGSDEVILEQGSGCYSHTLLLDIDSQQKLNFGTCGDSVVSQSAYLNDTNWHHVVFIFNKTTCMHKIYVDVADVPVDKYLDCGEYTDTGDIYLGRDIGGIAPGEGLNGSIDELMIFNRSLSPAEVQSLYDARADQFNYNDSTMKLRVNMDAINATGHPLDLSSHSHNLTKNGNAVQVDGRIGKAFSFDGNGDYINTTYQQINATKYSISAWIKTTDTTSNLGIVQNRGSGAGNSLTLGMNYLGSNRIFFAFDTDGTIIGRYYDSASVNNGAWHHVVGVFNGSASVTSSEFTLYFDGVSVSTGAFETGSGVAPLTGLGNTIIGYHEAFYNTYYNGLIDEVLIFNRTLSYSEVLTLYSIGNQYYNTFTNLTDGTHTFKAYAVDAYANKNQTETRQVTIDASLWINFTSPTPSNNSWVIGNSIYANVSSSSPREHYVFTDLDRSLVGYWRMDNISGTTVYDESGYANDGTCTNMDGTCNVTTGKYSNAMSFDGSDDYVDLSSNCGDFAFGTSPWSILTWIKTASNGGIIGLGNSVNEYQGLVFYVYNGKIQLDITGHANSGSSASVADGNWHHVSAEYNGSSLIYYVDGVSETIGAINPNIAICDSAWKGIGIDTGYGNFSGLIDEVLIFNRSLSSAEIQSLYNASAYQYQNNFTGFTTMNHTITAYGVDVSGRRNQTETREIHLDLPPTIHLVSPLNNINTNISSQNFVCNITDEVKIANLTLYIWNSTGSINYTNTTILTGTSNSSNWTYALPYDGNFKWNCLGYDNASQSVWSSEGNYTLLLDTVVPSINFTSPTPGNNTWQNWNNFYVNVSTSDLNDHYSFVDFDNSLVLWMRMDDVNGSGDPIDISGYGNNGSKQGNASQVSNGKFGKAFSFDGDGDYISYTSNGLPTGNSSRTVSLWFRANAMQHSSMLFYGNFSQDKEFGLQLSNTGSYDKLMFWGHGEPPDFRGTTTLQTGIWYHGVVTYNGTTITLYLNGQFENSENYVLNTGNSELRIGGGATQEGDYFNGIIDEVLIFNRSLSASEIQSLYNATAYQYQNNFTSVSEGTHYYKGYAVDIASNKNQTETRQVNVDLPPVVHLVSPANNSLINAAQNLSCNITDTFSISNITLYIWNSTGSINYTNTTILTGTSNSSNWTYALPYDGNFKWNCLGYDGYGSPAWSSEGNYTITYDTTLPSINFTAPTAGNNTITTNTFTEVNISITEANLTQFTFNWNGTNYTFYDDSLVLMYNFNNVSSIGDSLLSVTDLSSRLNNGTCVGMGSLCNYTTGKYGLGVNFDGVNDYVDFDCSKGLAFGTGNWSEFAWIKTGKSTGEIIAFGNGASTSQAVYLMIASGKLRLDLPNTVGPSTSATINDNTWHFVGASYNGTKIKLYVDGVENVSQSMSPNIQCSDTHAIGYNYGGHGWFNGSIDEVFIFNRTLSSDEISLLYRTQLYKYDTDKWQFYTNVTGISDGRYSYYGYAKDLAGNSNSTEAREFVTDLNIPTVHLVSPANNSLNHDPLNFTCNITDNAQIANLTLYIWNLSNALNYTNTTILTGVSNSTSWLYNFSSSGNFTWNCLGYDTAGNSSWSAEKNYTVRADNTNPSINFTAPTEGNNTFFSRNYLLVNVTASDTYFANVTVYLYNSSRQLLYSNASTSSPNFRNYSGLADGIYYFNATAYDNVTNQNSTETRQATVDTVYPSVNFTAPTEGNNSYLNRNNILVNVTISDTNLANITIYLYNSSRGLINSTNQMRSPFYVNFSNLTDGTYYFNATAFDNATNQNSTETRQATVDTINPSINFTAPTEGNNSVLGRNYILVNASATDTNFANITIYLYNSSRGLINSTNSTSSKYFMNFTNLTDGVYYFNATAFDNATNQNSTETRQATVDTTAPTINFTAPTEGNNSILNRNYILVNATVSDETALANISIYLYNSIGQLLNSSNQSTSPFYMNFSNLTDGTYYFNATAFDNAGNKNSTETRQATVDTTIPLISFASPTEGNNSYLNRNNILVNVSVTDTNLANVSISIYNSTGQLLNSTNQTTSPFFMNFSNLTDGTYYFNATAFDNATNQNSTETRIVLIDTIYPSINFTSPTPGNNSVVNVSDFLVNVSSSDANEHYSFVNFDRSLVLWLRMDDVNASGDPIDISEYRNNATAKNGAAQSASGKFGKSFNFDGSNDFVNISNSGSINITGSFTISAWINLASLPMSGIYQYLIAKRNTDGSHGGYGLFVVTSSGITYVRAVSSDGAGCFTGVIGSALSVNNWTHVVTVYNGTALKIFEQGQEQTDKGISCSRNPSSNSKSLVIGEYNDGTSFFNGSIDEVMIFNRSLSAAEVQSLYNASAYQYQNNFTNVADGNHSIQAYAVDIAANKNQTETRNIVVETHDYPPGWHDNVTNAPGKINEQKWFFVNWTDDKGLSNYVFSWNGTNGTWSNDSAVAFSGTINQSNVTKTLNLTRSNVISWRVYANDTAGQWNVTDIFSFAVENTPPSVVNLSLPANKSSTYDRWPTFNWSASYDPDGDSINYSISINESYCDTVTYPSECVVNPITAENLVNNNYTLQRPLGVDAIYNWSVRAWDGYNYSSWADQFNFTVNSLISMALDCTGCNAATEFGEVYNGFEYNTTVTGDSINPLIFENNGNVFADISINASNSLWEASYAGLGTSYFQFMAGNSTEANSFNWANSTTVWTNMGSGLNNATRYLNYSNATNRANIELRILVPSDETAGTRSSTLNLEARYTNGTIS